MRFLQLKSAQLFTRTLPSVMQRRFAQVVTGGEKCSTPSSRGLVLGIYSKEDDRQDIGCLTENGKRYNEVI